MTRFDMAHSRPQPAADEGDPGQATPWAAIVRGMIAVS